METHVKVLGILNIVVGALGLCLALMFVVIFGGAAVGASTDPDAAVAVPIIGITGTALVMFMVVTSLPAIIVGYALFRMRPWSRVGGIVVSILSLFVFPFGTALGVYGLWVLCSKEGQRLFETLQTAHV
jgi:hypothetical protein